LKRSPKERFISDEKKIIASTKVAAGPGPKRQSTAVGLGEAPKGTEFDFGAGGFADRPASFAKPTVAYQRWFCQAIACGHHNPLGVFSCPKQSTPT
jgi:hypothetical protein